MKPERIEELAREAWHRNRARSGNFGKWEDEPPIVHDVWVSLVRGLYAAAMRDAAGVARDAPSGAYKAHEGQCHEAIATALEIKAQEASDADHG